MKKLILAALLCLTPGLAFADFAQDQATAISKQRARLLHLINNGEFANDAEGCLGYVGIFNDTRANAIQNANAMGLDANPIESISPVGKDVCQAAK